MLPYLVTANSQTQMANTNGKITKQENEAIQNFHNEFLTSEQLVNLKSDRKEDPNNTYNILHCVIQDAKNKHMPTNLIKYIKYKHNKSKWVTFGIIKST